MSSGRQNEIICCIDDNPGIFLPIDIPCYQNMSDYLIIYIGITTSTRDKFLIFLNDKLDATYYRAVMAQLVRV